MANETQIVEGFFSRYLWENPGTDGYQYSLAELKADLTTALTAAYARGRADALEEAAAMVRASDRLVTENERVTREFKALSEEDRNSQYLQGRASGWIDAFRKQAGWHDELATAIEALATSTDASADTGA